MTDIDVLGKVVDYLADDAREIHEIISECDSVQNYLEYMLDALDISMDDVEFDFKVVVRDKEGREVII